MARFTVIVPFFKHHVGVGDFFLLVKLSFELTDIIWGYDSNAITHFLWYPIDYYTNFFPKKVPWGTLKGAGLPSLLYIKLDLLITMWPFTVQSILPLLITFNHSTLGNSFWSCPSAAIGASCILIFTIIEPFWTTILTTQWNSKYSENAKDTKVI